MYDVETACFYRAEERSQTVLVYNAMNGCFYTVLAK